MTPGESQTRIYEASRVSHHAHTRLAYSGSSECVRDVGLTYLVKVSAFLG